MGGLAGAVMLGLTLLALASAGVVVYKLAVFQQSKLDLGEFMARVRGPLLGGDVRAAIEVADGQRGPVAAIVRAGLARHGRAPSEVERAMEHAGIDQVAYLERYLTGLATIANIAPLLGFLGTVVGLGRSFDAIAARGLTSPALVAEGISVALSTTAWGLVVAFVTQPFYNYFVSRVAASTREMERAANVLLETFEEMKQGAGVA